MRRFAGILLVLLMLGFPFLAYAEGEKIQIRGDLEFGFYSQYIGSVTGSTIHDKPVFQQSFKLSVEPLGLYTKVWNSYSPKGGWNSDYGDEVDYVIGLRRRIVGEWNIDFGYAFYDMYKMGQIKGDLHGLYAGLDFPKIYQLSPFLYVEWDIPTDREIVKGGVVYRAGLCYTPKILKQPVNLEFSIAGHDNAYGYRAEFISSSRLSLSTPVKIWKLDLTPKINFQKRLGHYVREEGMTEDKIWGGLTLSYSF